MEIRAGDSLDELFVEIMLLFREVVEWLSMFGEEIDESIIYTAF